MKKLLSLVLSLTLVFALAGCGKEQTATYVLTTNEEGMVMTDTMTYSAKGDIVYEMKEDMVLDLSGLDEESKTFMVDLYNEYFGEMKNNAPDTVVMDYSITDDVLTVSIDIDIKNSDLQELVDGGFVTTTTDAEGKLVAISFEQSCTGLEASGYVLQE